MRTLVICFVALLVSACAPSLDDTVRVGVINVEESRVLSDFSTGTVSLKVDNFIDARRHDWIAEIVGGRRIDPDGSVADSVHAAYVQAIEKSGVRVKDSSPISVVAEVEEWKVSVLVDFPSSRADAQAAIKVHLLGRGDKLLYTGRYSGEAIFEHPLIEDKINQVLANAMGYAIYESLSDTDFVRTLVSESDSITGYR